MKKIFFCLIFLTLFFASGCARNEGGTVPDSAPELTAGEIDEDFDVPDDTFFDDEPAETAAAYNDPLEPMNRVFFEFNDKLYFWVLKPVDKLYSAVLPADVRFSIGHFFSNLSSPISLLNNLLQGNFTDAGIVFSRFVINSTLGVLGLGDPALIDFGLQPKPEDFGQTLGVWGVGEGVYLCWPVIGPSNVRDSFGFAADAYSHPIVYFYDDFAVTMSSYTVKQVNLLSLNSGAYEELKKYSLDPYISMRQVYLDYRRQKIQNKTPKQKTIDGF